MNAARDEDGRPKLQLFRAESGQVLVLTVLCCAVLLGFFALAVNVGMLFRARRNVQIAADAAATTAALDYYYNPTEAPATAANVGKAAATLNGVTDGEVVGGLTTTVTIDCVLSDYTTIATANCPGYFRAVLSQPAPTFIMSIFTGTNYTNVSALAVAGTPYIATDCVYVLNPNGNLGPGGGSNGAGVDKGTSSMWLQGSFAVTAKKCGIIVDGTSADALNLQGGNGNNQGTLTAGSIGVVGGCHGCNPPTYTGSVAPVSNPFQNLCVPYVGNNSPACPIADNIAASNCLNAASYGTASTQTPIGDAVNGGITCFTGDTSSGRNKGNLTLQNVTLSGTIVFIGSGTLTLSGNVQSGAVGSTIDLAYPTTQANNTNVVMTETSGTVLNLTAPTSSGSAFQSVVLMAPTNNYGIVEFDFGNSNGSLTGAVNGIIYLPSATFFLHDSGGDHSGGLTLTTDLVVGQLDDVTASLTINSYSASNPTLTPLKAVALVE